MTHPNLLSNSPLAGRPWRRRVLGASATVLSVLLLHAWLLDLLPGLGMGTERSTPAVLPRSLSFRSIELPSADQQPGPQARLDVRRQARQEAKATTNPAPEAAQRAAAPGRALPTQAAAVAASAAPVAVPARPLLAASPASDPGAAPGTDLANDSAGANIRVPQYRTDPPPAATLNYDLHRGMAGGRAVLSWQPEDAGYRLSLRASAFGIQAMQWTSEGEWDAQGLAPRRYSESRRGKEQRATNFQREAGKLTFSAQSAELGLPPGIQDRISWMVQLAAIVRAQPELALPGAQIVIPVVGTRGRPEAWIFNVLDPADLELPAGSVPQTVHLLREPSRPFDTRAQVWLDPARQHLPVRMQLLVHATGEGNEFVLSGTSFP